jgi:hypothetical protein
MEEKYCKIQKEVKDEAVNMKLKNTPKRKLKNKDMIDVKEIGKNVQNVYNDMEDERMLLAEAMYDDNSCSSYGLETNSGPITKNIEEMKNTNYVIPTTNTGREKVKIKLKEKKIRASCFIK